MYFIGVVSDSKKFKNIEKIIKSSNNNEFTLININRKSIGNLKNIKFDTIIFLDMLKNYNSFSKEFQEICCDIRYLIVNSDLEFEQNILENVKANIITFGLNHLATVTFSSATDEKIWISIQRSFKDRFENTVEVGEYSIKSDKKYTDFLYENMVIFVIFKLNYGKFIKI